MHKNECLNWKPAFVGGIIIGLLISVLVLGFLMILENPSSGTRTLPVQIIYEDNQNNYNGELARTSSIKMLEGGIVHVTFYNLTLSQTYYISMSQVGRVKEFNNTEEITIIIRAEEDNWCFLGGWYGTKFDFEYRDLIWIWIGEIEI